MTAVDAAGAIAAGDARAAGAIAVPAAIYRHRNMLRRGPLIRVRANRSHTNRLRRDYEPIILPGESLAKYKDRIPAAPAAPPAEAPADTSALRLEPPVPPIESAPDSATGQTAPGLPASLYASGSGCSSCRARIRDRRDESPRPCHQPKNFFARCRWFLRNRSSNR